MNDPEDKEFWSKQTSSLHRSDDEGFYRGKAEEHAALMTPGERSAGCVDLGCGAGELLFHFTDHANVLAGVDYSQSMLDQAARTLDGKNVALLNADIFEYLPDAGFGVWTTTGAINQYLDPVRLNAFLDMFASNREARAVFLFDCVDPIRYLTLPFGSSYRLAQPPRGSGLKAHLRPAHRLYRRWLVASRLALGRLAAPSTKLGSANMGYGYLPRFWIDAAALRNLRIDIVSSRFYEYRYHVALRKISD